MDVLIVIGTTASYFYSLFAVLMNMKAPKTHSKRHFRGHFSLSCE